MNPIRAVMLVASVALGSALATSTASTRESPVQEESPASSRDVSSEPRPFKNIRETTTTTTPPPTTTTTAPPPEPEPKPKPEPFVAEAASEPVVADTGGYADPNNPATWDRLAGCESGGDWHINTGNGYYGGLQFALSSWQAVGGSGYPHEHSREEQIKRAQMLWQSGGWNHWPACSSQLGYR